MCPWQVSLYRSCHVVSHSITYVCVCVCVCRVLQLILSTVLYRIQDNTIVCIRPLLCRKTFCFDLKVKEER